jgi:hypothetical protein
MAMMINYFTCQLHFTISSLFFLDLGVNVLAKIILKKIVRKNVENHDKLQSIKIAHAFFKSKVIILFNHV